MNNIFFIFDLNGFCFFCSLHQEVCDFYEFMKCRPDEHKMREDAVSRVQQVVENLWPTAQVMTRLLQNEFRKCASGTWFYQDTYSLSLVDQVQRPYWENIIAWALGTDQAASARSLPERPRADILPVWSRADSVSKRSIMQPSSARKAYNGKCSKYSVHEELKIKLYNTIHQIYCTIME